MSVAATATKTLFIPMQDYSAELEDETNRWFDRDHVPERLSCAGFLGCERFQRTAIEPPGWSPAERWYKYLNVYSVESPEVLRSEAYRLQRPEVAPANQWRARQQQRRRAEGRVDPRSTARSFRTLWTRRANPWARAGTVSLPPPRTIYVVLRDVDSAYDAELNRYLDEEAVPELLGCPGFLGCERYEAAEIAAVPGRADPVHPRYMDVYDVETPEVLSSDAYWLQQASPSEWAGRLAGRVTVRGSGVYLQRPSPWAVSPA